MNLETAIAQAESVKVKLNDESGAKSLMVAPSTQVLPNDGFLEYATISSVYDFEKIHEGSVVMFAPDQYGLLKLVGSHTIEFGVTLRVLTGIPGADYGVGFEQVVWNLETVAYSPLLSELSLDAEIARQRSENDMSTYRKEMQRVEKSDGSVKAHTDFTVENRSEVENGRSLLQDSDLE